jgi:hypothetical protein
MISTESYTFVGNAGGNMGWSRKGMPIFKSWHFRIGNIYIEKSPGLYSSKARDNAYDDTLHFGHINIRNKKFYDLYVKLFIKNI